MVVDVFLKNVQNLLHAKPPRSCPACPRPPLSILLTFGHGQEDRPQRHRRKHHIPSLTQNAPDLRSCSLWIEGALDEAHHRTRVSEMHRCVRRLAWQARRLIERQLHFSKTLHQSRQFFGKAQSTLLQVADVACKTLDLC